MSKTIDFIKTFFPEKRPSTLLAYSTDLDYFKLYLNKKSAQDAFELLINLPENQANLVVLHYKSELLQSSQSIASINRKLSTLRSLVNAARKMGLVGWKLNINNEKIENNGDFKSLSRNQIKALLNAARNQANKKKAARDYAIIRLMYDLALKRNFITCLQINHFNKTGKTLEIVTEGKRLSNLKILPKKTNEALINWLEFRGKEAGPLFNNFDVAAKKPQGISSTSLYRIVKQLGDSIGLQVTPEEIRKSAISEATMQAKILGISDQELLAFSDHKNVVSLKRFNNRKIKVQGSLSNLIAKN